MAGRNGRRTHLLFKFLRKIIQMSRSRLPCGVTNALSEIYPISRRALHTQTGFVSLAGFTASVLALGINLPYISVALLLSRLLRNFTSHDAPSTWQPPFRDARPGGFDQRSDYRMSLCWTVPSLFILIQEQCLKYRSGLQLTLIINCEELQQ